MSLYIRVDPKLLSAHALCMRVQRHLLAKHKSVQGSSRSIDKAQNEIYMLKLREVTPVYVRAVEQTPAISSVQRMEIKNEQRYAIQFCVCSSKTLQETCEMLHQAYTDRCLCDRLILYSVPEGGMSVGGSCFSCWSTSDGAH